MVDSVVNVAIHNLEKHGSDFDVVLGKNQLTISKTVIRVVNELHKMYASRASKAHGKFSDDTVNFPAQTFISNFVQSDFQGFEALTKGLMTVLLAQARRKSGATGGHVLFAHFEKDKQLYLLVAIINDRLGALLNEDMDISDVRHLDLDGFRFAGRVNISAWTSGADRYIGFLKGKGDVAEYFKEFLGCDTTVQDRVDTTALINVLRDFAEQRKDLVTDKDAFLQRAFDICQRHIRENAPLDFESFANEMLPDDPSKLSGALGDPDVALGDGFVPDKRALNALVKFRVKTDLWSMEFDRRAIAQGKIVYDPHKKTITIKELPQDLIQELDRDRE
ncbi:nucleoid-associated protein [Rhizobium rosettiformans]|uniref:Nucleoid-associated protein n=2 Tax=Rhizobium rosettiformans TaxID=1368430 RepID=A0A4S8PTJ0_9HYPH|nr:nucleoid-associated protein [Rhizobium rosettiformans]MBB5276912.1 nucleoid-associated protein [Rhizobium rosettiformans]THV34727.1 nucleoid-associated protein [Rhizobium rosettiformans W3]